MKHPKHYETDAIASELAINPIRAKILRKNSMIISQKRINQVLEDLYKVELEEAAGLSRYSNSEISHRGFC